MAKKKPFRAISMLAETREPGESGQEEGWR
jgi:hypothetical protein